MKKMSYQNFQAGFIKINYGTNGFTVPINEQASIAGRLGG